jgi:hypothetical protein
MKFKSKNKEFLLVKGNSFWYAFYNGIRKRHRGGDKPAITFYGYFYWFLCGIKVKDSLKKNGE